MSCPDSSRGARPDTGSLRFPARPGIRLALRVRIFRDKQLVEIQIGRYLEYTLADAVDQSLGDQAAIAVEDVVHLVIIGIRIALHPEKLRARLPDRYRDVVERERLGNCPSDLEQGQPVA